MAPPALIALHFNTEFSKSILSPCHRSKGVRPSGYTFYSAACGVAVGENYIISGGHSWQDYDDALQTVAEYSQTGFVRYLPSMIQGRYLHACSSFMNGNGETV